MKTVIKTRLLAFIAAILSPLSLLAQQATQQGDSSSLLWGFGTFLFFLVIAHNEKKKRRSTNFCKPSKKIRKPTSTAKKRDCRGNLWQHHQDIYRDWGIII